MYKYYHYLKEQVDRFNAEYDSNSPWARPYDLITEDLRKVEREIQLIDMGETPEHYDEWCAEQRAEQRA